MKWFHLRKRMPTWWWRLFGPLQRKKKYLKIRSLLWERESKKWRENGAYWMSVPPSIVFFCAVSMKLQGVCRIILWFYELKTWLAIRSVRTKLELAGEMVSILFTTFIIDFVRQFSPSLHFTFLMVSTCFHLPNWPYVIFGRWKRC
jgi:cobalamin biosynthesis protein CobD/CbiB